MSHTIQIDGKDVTVYTQEEMNEGKNAAAKAARLEAESATKAKYDPQILDLTGKADQATQLQTQLANLTTERDGLKSERDALDHTIKLTKAFKAGGLPDTVIDIALNHKAADGLDPSNTAALESFLAPFKSLGQNTPPTPPPPGGGGSPTGDLGVPKTVAEVEAKIASDPNWAADPKNWEIVERVTANGV